MKEWPATRSRTPRLGVLHLRRGWRLPSCYSYDARDQRVINPAHSEGTAAENLSWNLIYQANWLTIQIGNKRYGLSRYRLYDFETGTFLSRDFLPYMNKYRAWSNNPVGQVDRNGLATESSDPYSAQNVAKRALESAERGVGHAEKYLQEQQQYLNQLEKKHKDTPIYHFQEKLVDELKEDLKRKLKELEDAQNTVQGVADEQAAKEAAAASRRAAAMARRVPPPPARNRDSGIFSVRMKYLDPPAPNQTEEEQRLRALGRKWGAFHYDIWYENMALFAGAAGPTPPGYGENIEYATYIDVEIREDGRLKHGKRAGTACACASDDDVIDCIKSHPCTIAPGTYTTAGNSCQEDVQRVLKNCCLSNVNTQLEVVRELLEDTFFGGM